MGQLVIREKTGDVKGSIHSEMLPDPAAHRLDHLGMIIQGGHNEIDNFQPDICFFHRNQGFEDGRQGCRTHVLIELFTEPFEVDLDGVEHCEKLKQGISVHITVGDDGCLHPFFFGQSRNVIKILVVDRRLRVRKGDGGKSILHSLLDNL